MRLLSRVAAPAVTPISVTELKAHLRIEHTDEDTMLGDLIKVAVSEFDGRDGILRRALVTQTWDLFLPWFPVERRILLPMPPLQSVTSIKYFDGSNVEQTFDTSNYEVVSEGRDGYVMLLQGKSWPATYEREKAIAVRFVCGYGGATEVPQPIRNAMLIRGSQLYSARGDESSDGKIAIGGGGLVFTQDASIDRLLRPYRVVTV